MFEVYFVWGDGEGQRDFLERFDTLEEAKAYRLESVINEGWDDDEKGGEAEQYVIQPRA